MEKSSLDQLNQQLLEDFVFSVDLLERQGNATVEQLARRDTYQEMLAQIKLQKTKINEASAY